MKGFIILFGAFAVILATVHAFPADGQRFNPERDVEEIPMGSYPMERPSGMGGFLGSFNDMFERLRQQMVQLLSMAPSFGQGTPDGGETTSVTKIIDGHKVVINETVYRSGNGEDTAAVFKVRVVDIHQSDNDGAEEEPSRSVESIENNHANEISNSHQKRKVNSMEMLDNYDGLESFGYPESVGFDEWSSNDIETFDDVDTGAIDLSNDIYVNEIAAAAGQAYQHPDAEAISFEALPHEDLSRDTYVNEIAARENWPLNPHAEFINPQGPHKSLHDKSESIQDYRFLNSNNNREFPSRLATYMSSPVGRQAFNRRDPFYYKIDNS